MLNPSERRRDVFAAAKSVDRWALCAVTLGILSMFLGVIVAIVKPDSFDEVRDLIMVVALPLCTTLLAMSQKAYATVVNGQLGLLLKNEGEKSDARAEAAHNAGIVEGLKDAPQILKGGNGD
jgi:hypothetical protein